MPGVDELEEEHRVVLANRQVADLARHEQRGSSSTHSRVALRISLDGL